MEISRKIHAPATLSPGNQPNHRVVTLHGLLNRSGRFGEQNNPWSAKSRNPQLVARHLLASTNLSSSAHSVLRAFRDTKIRLCSSKYPGLYGMHAQSNFLITNTNTTNTRVVSKYRLSGLRKFAHKYFMQITSNFHERVKQTMSVRNRLIHGGQSRQCST
jgi:hypothetical protein